MMFNVTEQTTVKPSVWMPTSFGSEYICQFLEVFIVRFMMMTVFQMYGRDAGL